MRLTCASVVTKDNDMNIRQCVCTETFIILRLDRHVVRYLWIWKSSRHAHKSILLFPFSENLNPHNSVFVGTNFVRWKQNYQQFKHLGAWSVKQFILGSSYYYKNNGSFTMIWFRHIEIKFKMKDTYSYPPLVQRTVVELHEIYQSNCFLRSLDPCFAELLPLFGTSYNRSSISPQLNPNPTMLDRRISTEPWNIWWKY